MTGDRDPPPDLELRARPRPIRRLNKRALMIGSGVVALLIAGATIVALNPPTLVAPDKRPELYNTERKQTAEGLAKLPKSYAEIPQLGPPVPGDIGRALVESEKRAVVAPPTLDAPFRPNPEEEAERAERIRQARIAQSCRAPVRTEVSQCLTNRPRFAGLSAVQTRGVRSLPRPEVAIAAIFGTRSLRSPNPFLAQA